MFQTLNIENAVNTNLDLLTNAIPDGINEICRICLTKQEDANLFSLYNSNEDFSSFPISTAINECFGINLHKDSNLPNFICRRCASNTLEAYTFKKTILNTENLINTRLLSNIEIFHTDEENDTISSRASPLSTIENSYGIEIDENSFLHIGSDHNYSKESSPVIEDAEFSEQRKLETEHSDGEDSHVSIKTRENTGKSSIKPLSNASDKWWLKDLGPPYVCKLCDRNYNACYKAFYSHVRRHFMKKHSCVHCGKKFLHDQLIQHIRTHTKEKPFKCEQCAARFSLQKNLKRHTLCHTNDVPFICDICGKGFRQMESMQHHKENHSGTTQIVCEFCGKSFIANQSYRYHKLRYHKDESVKSINTRESQENEVLKCNQCNKVFSKLQSLTRHYKTHNDSNNIKCETCESTFQVNFSYNAHMFLHEVKMWTSDLLSFNCKFCSDTFINKEDLEDHILNHVNKPFQCKHCDKLFSSKIRLDYHLKSINRGVNEEKKYECHYCAKTFAWRNYLTVHIRRHTGDTPFHCDICGKGFHDCSSRRKHVIRNHKDDAVEKFENS